MPTPDENPSPPVDEATDSPLYVPLSASERALSALRSAIREGRTPILLAGPAGVGKTTILLELAERERAAGQRTVRSWGALRVPPEHVASWLLHRLLSQDTRSEADAEAALQTALGERGAEHFLLAVDDIEQALPDSLSRLTELARATRARLTLVASGTVGNPLSARLPRLEPQVTVSMPAILPDADLELLRDSLLSRPALAAAFADGFDERERAALLSEAEGRPDQLERALERRAAKARVLESVEVHRRRRHSLRAAAFVAVPALLVSAFALAALRWIDRSAASRPSSARELRAPAQVEPPPVAAPPVAAPPVAAPPVAAPPVAARPAQPRTGTARETLPPAAAPAMRTPAVPAPAVAPPPSITVQVNARPWARVRIDGVDLGATPLSHTLPAGVHQVEADFADGRTVRRQVEIGPERRFLSLP